MMVYIFGENYAGKRDWYYTAAKLREARWVQLDTKKHLVFMAVSTEPYRIGCMEFGYMMSLREMVKGIRNHNLFFRRAAAETEAHRRWQERFGG